MLYRPASRSISLLKNDSILTLRQTCMKIQGIIDFKLYDRIRNSGFNATSVGTKCTKYTKNTAAATVPVAFAKNKSILMKCMLQILNIRILYKMQSF